MSQISFFSWPSHFIDLDFVLGIFCFRFQNLMYVYIYICWLLLWGNSQPVDCFQSLSKLLTKQSRPILVMFYAPCEFQENFSFLINYRVFVHRVNYCFRNLIGCEFFLFFQFLLEFCNYLLFTNLLTASFFYCYFFITKCYKRVVDFRRLNLLMSYFYLLFFRVWILQEAETRFCGCCNRTQRRSCNHFLFSESLLSLSLFFLFHSHSFTV